MKDQSWGSNLTGYADPRPDLKDDSPLWRALLFDAYHYSSKEKQRSQNFCAALNYMRCGGTRIEAGSKSWVLRPHYDIEGKTGWLNEEQYEREKQYLEPFKDWLILLLKDLTKHHPLPKNLDATQGTAILRGKIGDGDK